MHAYNNGLLKAQNIMNDLLKDRLLITPHNLY